MLKMMGAVSVPLLNVTVGTDAWDLNLFTAAGSPAYKCVVTITIASGIKVRHNAGVAALRTGSGWAPGSVVRLVNNGMVYGNGGAGGAGGDHEEDPPGVGDNGSDAIYLEWPLTIDNTAGKIFGGGKGGNGGAGVGPPHGGGSYAAGGGGGGGGQGGAGGPSGPGGDPGGGAPPGAVGADGTSGTEDAPGTGGAAGYNFLEGWADDGSAAGYNFLEGWADDGSDGFTWGEGGSYAVKKNGHAVTWIAGNNSSQVKGQVA